MIAGLAIVVPRSILLVHPTGTPLEGTWSIPKGHIDKGETAEEAAVREVEEEVGIRVPMTVLHGSPSRLVLGQFGKNPRPLFYWSVDVRTVGLPQVIPESWLQLEEVDMARFVPIDEARILLEVDMWPVLSTIPVA